MKIKLNPAIRLSLGLVFLTVSILVIAQGLGLIPNQSSSIILSRQNLAETIAMQTTLALKRNDDFMIQSIFAQSVRSYKTIQSVALRRLDNTLQYSTRDHEEFWGKEAPKKSTPTHVQVPILVDGNKAATIEISFVPVTVEANAWLGIPRFAWFLTFICISSFSVFLFYIKRVLHHLDPSSVVPTRVRNALNVMAEGVLIIDKREKIVLINESLATKLGASESGLIGRNANEIGWIRENRNEQLPWQLAQEHNHKLVGARISLKSRGKNLTFNVNAVPILDGKGKSLGVISSFDDITELEDKTRQLEKAVNELTEKQHDIESKNKELVYLASRDPLTSCYNRSALISHIDTHFKRSSGGNTEFCVIIADIDNFTNINDAHGHEAGDDVIRGMAQTLVSRVRPGDIVARFGAEEFCIFLPNTTPERAFAIADMCRKKIEARLIGGMNVTASFGVSSSLFGAKCSNDLIHQADKALREAKSQGRNRTATWSQQMVA